MREHQVNKEGNFLSGWYMEDDGLFDKIIAFHTTAKTRTEGRTASNEDGSAIVDPSVKRSYDSNLYESPELIEKYFKLLQPIVNKYIEQYPYSNYYSPWRITDAVNVQHYPPGGGYYSWHTERTASCEPSTSRHLVFMTYLNDVNEGGETEFFHQKLKIKPEKGLTLIWPADWTFTHRGVVAPNEDKYLITSWFNFV